MNPITVRSLHAQLLEVCAGHSADYDDQGNPIQPKSLHDAMNDPELEKKLAEVASQCVHSKR